MPTKLSQERFNQLLNQRNARFAPVESTSEYTGRHTQMLFRCDHDHTWQAEANNVLRGAGCPSCSGKKPKLTLDIKLTLERLNATRSNKVFLVEGQQYISSFKRLMFSCENNHVWQTTTSNVINGKQGCRVCSGKQQKTHDYFVNELGQKRPDITLIDSERYTTAHAKLLFRCKALHVWLTRPIDVLLGGGCPHCVNKGYSRKAIRWLTEISPSIRHAENGGEFLIPGTSFYADGYDSTTNTIYEFYGDVYHGNPTVFCDTDHCHPYDKRLTAKPCL